MTPLRDSGRPLPPTIEPGQPVTALAPMQDVTTLPYMQVVGRCGPPDYFFTEYFRVHDHSTLEKHIVASITDHGTGRPVFAQIIGENLEHIGRTLQDLEPLPTAGIDLNMGCPAPKIYKKNVGGGLLRDLGHVDRLLGFMRETIPGLFTVKTRIGFEDTENFEGLLEIVDRHRVDLFSLHGRTVAGGYRSEVDYGLIRRAAERLRCPVLANGNITSAEKARDVLAYTGCAGVMIGRSAIRNPWIFRQIRDLMAGRRVFQPTLGNVRAYLDEIRRATYVDGMPEKAHVGRLKKFFNFVGLGVDPAGEFLHRMRRAKTMVDLFAICDAFCLHNGRSAQPFTLEPYDGLIARPNCEAPVSGKAEPASTDGCRL
ncbi:MAG: tRNA dihydrouridine synthase [Opitutales bacterium]